MKKALKILFTTIFIFTIFSVGRLSVNIENELYTKNAQQTYGSDEYFDSFYLNKRRSLRGIPKIDYQDGYFGKIGKEVGLKHIDKLNIVSKNPQKTFSDQCGKYDVDSRTIYLEKTGDEKIDKANLAHEYLHFIWFEPETLISTDQKLHSKLMSFYNSNIRIKGILDKYYVPNDYFHFSELFSYACTEFNDNELDKYIVFQCNKWVNRDKLSLPLDR